VVVIAERTRSAGQVFVWGEDARLAAALASVARRQDLEIAPFSAWFDRVASEHEVIWSGPPKPGRYLSERVQLNSCWQHPGRCARCGPHGWCGAVSARCAHYGMPPEVTGLERDASRQRAAAREGKRAHQCPATDFFVALQRSASWARNTLLERKRWIRQPSAVRTAAE
jgi:hypothetical protein